MGFSRNARPRLYSHIAIEKCVKLNNMKIKLYVSNWIFYFEGKPPIELNKLLSEVVVYYQDGTYRLNLMNATFSKDVIDNFVLKNKLNKIEQKIIIYDTEISSKIAECYTYINPEIKMTTIISKHDSAGIVNLDIRGVS